MKRLAFALCALVLFSVTQTSVVQAKPTNCMGCDFSHADFHGRDFRGVNYTGADFAGTNLQNADFSGARLTGVDFKNADLRSANLTNVDCTGCEFRGAQLGGAKLQNLKLTGADLRGALGGLSDQQLHALLDRCTGCDLRGENVHGHDLSNLTMIGADMQDLDGSSARFNNARLVGVDFRRANLRNADFSGAALCWHNTIRDDGVQTRHETECAHLDGADVRGARFTGIRICDVDGGSWNCRAVDAATLRRYSGSSFDGATLQ